MIVWHASKTEEGLLGIQETMTINTGRNLSSTDVLAHVTSKKFLAGSWALDVIGKDTNEAWILEVEIPDDTPLVDDPADDAGDLYGGGWLVSEKPIPLLKIKKVEYIENVQAWESREIQSRVWR